MLLDNQNTIFVSICGIDELDLEQTIISCLDNADFPQNIWFGISVQYQKLSKSNFSKFKNVTVLYLESENVYGVGLSRLMSYSAYNKQKYFLQIDGHMLFEKSWDTTCIRTYEEATKLYGEVLVTGYVPSWYRENCKIVKFPTQNVCLSVEPEILNNPNSRSRQAGQPLLGSISGKQILLGNSIYAYEQQAVSYHFIFAHGNFGIDFLPDPNIVYNGDEITLSTRAWTRGYKFILPTPAPLNHLDKVRDEIYSNMLNWKKFSKENKQITPPSEIEIYRQHLSYERVKDILVGKTIGYWGAANTAKLAEYEKLVNCDFKKFFELVENNNDEK